jgi:hypothetical protein
MKVKEICKIMSKENYTHVYHEGKYLEGHSPIDFLDCELEVKDIYVGDAEDIVFET